MTRFRPALIAALMLLAGCSGGGGGRPSPPHTVPPATATPPQDPVSIQAFIPAAEAFVEAHRGLRFKHPVTVTFLSDAAFRARLARDQPLDQAAVRVAAKELRALALLPEGVDLGRVIQELLAGAVEGFYDPRTKELVVRGVQPTPYVREVLVHELTHALQDQWFGISHPELDRDTTDERPLAYHSLLEGDAVRIQSAYRASLPVDDQLRAAAEENQAAGGIGADIPLVLIETLDFPYIDGPAFVDALLLHGQSRLDAAFDAPPVDSAQIMHPDRFLAGDRPVTVAQPVASGTAFDHGAFGEFMLQLLLQDAANHGQVAPGEVQTTHDAWGGDQYVAWDSGAQSCIRIAFAPLSAAELPALAQGLDDLGRTRPGVTVTGTSPVTLTSCG